jgi:hypothetical protein
LAVPTGTASATATEADTATPTATETLAVPTGTAAATATNTPLDMPTPTETLAVPTGTTTVTATATATAPSEPGEGGPCDDLGAPLQGICRAHCALGCDGSSRITCRILRILFRVFGGDGPPTCTAMTATSGPCGGLEGRAARVCEKVCARCERRGLTSSSCLRLQRHFARMTGGAALSCGAKVAVRLR